MANPLLSPRYASLLRDNAELRAQLATANARIAELMREIGRLAELVAAGNDRTLKLLAIAERIGRKARKDAPAKPPEPSPSVSDEQRDAYANRPRAPELPAEDKKPKRKQKPTGRKPIPKHLEAEEHTVVPEACSCCGGADLESVDEVVETKLHVVKARPATP